MQMSDGAGTMTAEKIAGEFKRQEDSFRYWVTDDGSSEFPAAAGRYHLYVSLACPWAHRTIIARRLKGLEEIIGMTVVDPIRDGRGWAFVEEADPVNGFQFLSEVYRQSDPQYRARVTVPVLFDKETSRIVNNSEVDIVRMFNSSFAEWAKGAVDLYPEPLRAEIDAFDDLIYPSINNGVYRAGFAETQAAYEAGVKPLFEALDQLEEHLATQRYLCGSRITEADWKLFVTLVRFDEVYYVHFKCNVRRIAEYKNLWAYLRDLYQQPGIAETVNMDHIKRHYYMTHDDINPFSVVPLGPRDLDFMASHGREELG
jgi:glutathionyl-hydroquinone reductase